MNQLRHGKLSKFVAMFCVMALVTLIPAQQTKGDFGLIIAAIAAAAAVVGAGTAVYVAVREPAPSPEAPCITVDGRYRVTTRDGTVLEGDGHATIYSRSPGTIMTPEDLKGLGTLPPGFIMDSVDTIDSSDDSNAITVLFDSVQNQANVLDPALKAMLGELPEEVTWTVDRLATGRWEAIGPPNGDEALVINLDVNIELATVDVPLTHGTAAYKLVVSSPQLGTIFTSTAAVAQGGDLVVSGDIDAKEFNAERGSGAASISKTIKIPPIPVAEFSTIEYEVLFMTTGSGVTFAP